MFNRGVGLQGAGEGCEPFANEFDTHTSPQIGESMEPLFKLLSAMASPQSGISDYWRNKLQDVLRQVPQEPRNMAEVVEDDPPVAEMD